MTLLIIKIRNRKDKKCLIILTLLLTLYFFALNVIIYYLFILEMKFLKKIKLLKEIIQ